MDRLTGGSIQINQIYLSQSIINMIPGMDNSNSNPTFTFNPTQEKNEGYQSKNNYFNYIPVIRSLTFLTNTMNSEAKQLVANAQIKSQSQDYAQSRHLTCSKIPQRHGYESSNSKTQSIKTYLVIR